MDGPYASHPDIIGPVPAVGSPDVTEVDLRAWTVPAVEAAAVRIGELARATDLSAPRTRS